MRIGVAAAFTTGEAWVLALRVLVAAALGGLVGFEREFRGQPAGFRTHILVAVGAALFTLTGEVAAGDGVDRTRIAAQVVTGIGFLGAGAIIQQGVSVRGLTTAATLWVVAAVGTAAGLGYYEGALAATAVTLVSLVAFKRLERLLFPQLAHPERQVQLAVTADFRLADAVATVHDHAGTVLTTQLGERDGEREATLSVRLSGRTAYEDLLEALLRVDGVRHVGWAR